MRRIPIGISDFKTVIEDNFLFIDKTMLIKEFWESNGQTILLPRPRRFGKTLNMSMIKYFFSNEENKDANKSLFTNLEIEKHEDIMRLQGKYPVIYISFKDEKHSSFENLMHSLKNLFGALYRKHEYCLDNDKIDISDKNYYTSILEKSTNNIDLSQTVKLLSKFLSNYHNQKVIILIDEYDVPIQAAYMHGYYDETMEFMRNLLSRAFKDNIYLQKAMITGKLSIVNDSVFSGLNNLIIKSILSYDFSDKFGFTEVEVENLATQYGVNEKIDEIKQWYNGYYFGQTTIYNPWSILNYIAKPRAGLKPYWVNTSSNDLVKVLISKGGQDVKKDLESLISGEAITKYIDENIAMADIEKSSDNLWSFLLFTGYLKARQLPRNEGEDEIYHRLQIPNKEVKMLYKRIITAWFNDTISKQNYDIMLNALLSADLKTFTKILKSYVLKSLSYFDVGGNEGEKVYHAFVLGMLISLRDTHEVSSNRESGYGRYDVCIIPKDVTKLGIIIEFKKLDIEDEETMEEMADEALEQIEDKKYETTLRSRGIENILKVAIVFKGKEVLVKK